MSLFKNAQKDLTVEDEIDVTSDWEEIEDSNRGGEENEQQLTRNVHKSFEQPLG